MKLDLAALFIEPSEVEEIIDLNITASLAVDLNCTLKERKPQQLFSLLLSQLSTLLLIAIFIFPLSLMLLDSSGNLPPDARRISQLLLLLSLLCLGCLAGWNYYLWRQIPRVKSLVRLLTEVNKYNQAIEAIALLESIDLARDNQEDSSSVKNHQEVIEVLQATRKSLLSALKVEKLMRKHQDFLGQRHEVLANFETNLQTLLSFQTSPQAEEYQNLIDGALQIGLAVHKEVNKLRYCQ